MPQPSSPDDRSPLAVAMEWSSRLTAVSLEMVLPAVAGYWLDQWLGTVMVFLVLGAVVGLVTGMWHLIRMTESPPEKRREEKPPADENREP